MPDDCGRLDIYLQQGNDGLGQIEFQGFPKIPRLNRDIIITEKIDGTNAQILITEDGQIFAGSRKRWLTEDKDNYGFCAWVQEHRDELLELGPGRYYGEWWGQGIQRKYGLDHKRFSLFNVNRWQSHCNSLVRLTKLEAGERVEIERIYPPDCCDVVPIVRYGMFGIDIINSALSQLRDCGSLAALGFMKPEGIVIYHTAGNYLFKVTLENDEQWKGNTNAS